MKFHDAIPVEILSFFYYYFFFCLIVFLKKIRRFFEVFLLATLPSL